MILESQVTYILSLALYVVMLTTLITAIGTYAVYKMRERRKSKPAQLRTQAIHFQAATSQPELATGKRRRVRFGT